jgi:hypothetical protein
MQSTKTSPSVHTPTVNKMERDKIFADIAKQKENYVVHLEGELARATKHSVKMKMLEKIRDTKQELVNLHRLDGECDTIEIANLRRALDMIEEREDLQRRMKEHKK